MAEGDGRRGESLATRRDSPPAIAAAADVEIPSAIATIADLWLHDLDPDTQRAYLADVAAFCSVTGARDLRKVTLAELHAFEDALRAAGKSSATIARRLSGVKSLLTFAQRVGMITFNVGAAKRRPKVLPTFDERTLPFEFIVRIFAAARTDRDRMVVKVFYYTGARPEEVHRLHWRHITLDDRGHGVVRLHGKGDKVRWVLIPAFLFRELVEFRAAAADEAPIFAGRAGSLSIRALRKVVTRTGHRAGVPRMISPYWLRHAHGSHAHDRGAPIALVQRDLGHESLATTGKYLHARPGDGSALYLPAL